jgi:hypothetical protein
MAKNCFAAAMCALLASSCALQASNRPRMSLASALQLLPTLSNASDLTEKMGEPDSKGSFNHDDPTSTDYLNRQSLDLWRQLVVATPERLLDTLPVGTKLFDYTFVAQWDAINPWTGELEVCVDDNDRIVGWMYSRSLVGIESKAPLR